MSVNGKSIKALRDSIAALIPSSNKHFTDNAVSSIILALIEKDCDATVIRNQQVLELSERKANLYYERKTIPVWRKISPNIAYVDFMELGNKLQQITDPEEYVKLVHAEVTGMMDSIADCKGIIFNLRCYTWIDTWDILSRLSSTQEYQYALANLADLSHCGSFYKHDCITKCPDELWNKRKKYNGKMVVLINAATQSMAETDAMMYRVHGVALIGTPTAGANGEVVRFCLPGGIDACYSGVGFYFPNGTQLQRTGIIPDIEVDPTMDDIMAGRDEVLEAAIQYLNSN